MRIRAILIDPTSVESIAAGMTMLWTNEEERTRLVQAGRQRLSRWLPEDFSARLYAILDEVEARLVRPAA